MEAAPTPGATPHVLVIPFPAQGHALPLLDFVALLAARGLRLTVVTTPANLQLLSPLLAAHPTAVRAATFPFPSHPSLPPGLENTKGCSPGHFPAFVHALAELRRPILAWVKAQPDPVVADFFCGWARPLAREIGAAGIVFSPSGVLGTAVPHSTFRRLVRRPAQCDDDDEFSVSFPAIPGEPSFQWRDVQELHGWRSGRAGRRVREAELPVEPERQLGVRVQLVQGAGGEVPGAAARGPGLQARLGGGTRGSRGGRRGHPRRAGIRRARRSQRVAGCVPGRLGRVRVLRELLSPAVAAALAEALERSAVPFVWAVGGAVVPDGFEARAAAARRGVVVRGWAPQVALLRHPAVGWFLTHCGWNSTLEWPLVADQFFDARLLVDEARVAVRACRGGLGFVPDAGELASVLADATGEKGRDVRARAKALAAEAARAVKPGGSSYADLELLVQEIRKLPS